MKFIVLWSDWVRLADVGVWVDAATQVIFSLGPACGCVITLSSYNKFTRDCHRDAVLIALTNSVTSLFSGSQNRIVIAYTSYIDVFLNRSGGLLYSWLHGLGYKSGCVRDCVSW